MATTVLVGATSAIGRALAHRLGARGDRLVLAGRRPDALRDDAADLRIRYGADVSVLGYDAQSLEDSASFFRRCIEETGGGVDNLVTCHGVLVDSTRPEALRANLEINYLSHAALFEDAANHFQERRRGCLCAISSVAGDRGRASNYHYGAAKAALDTLLEGLRQRLKHFGVHVLTVKPGFVDTPMTYGRPGMFLVASPDCVARDIERAMGKRCSVLYTPWFWRPIMAAIRAIPGPIFDRMRL
jgi:NAD(P)-dependent dehydrogenase (short-subunit alcohol dehydrogenase family)